jgi:hypothetical protein
MIAAPGPGPGNGAARSSHGGQRCTKGAADVIRFELEHLFAGDVGRRPARASRLLIAFALSCAMALAGCAQQRPAQREVKAEPAPAAAPMSVAVAPAAVAPAPVAERPQWRVRRPARALLVSQPAPDCEFRGTDRKTVDEVEWARLKLDYERQCYQRAEKVTRERLRQLQASSRCEIEPARHPLTTIR